MKLPSKFQFRDSNNLGHTHTAKVEGELVKVKWARGWHIVCQDADLWDVCALKEAQYWINEGGWIIVDEKKPQEDALPDVIHFKLYGNPYVLTKSGCNWQCWHKGQVGHKDQGSYYSEEELKKYFADGTWERYEPVVLTAEQKRANKEFRSRIASLESSIKLTQQSIEHYNRMVANYEQQIKDLEAKIVEGDE